MAEKVGAEIERKRGDTAPDVVNISLAGGIAGFTYAMTVNRVKNPTDTAQQVATMAGTIMSSDPNGGAVSFPWTSLQADQAPGTYWYDVQQTDTAGKVKTIAKNKYRFYQDITKS